MGVLDFSQINLQRELTQESIAQSGGKFSVCFSPSSTSAKANAATKHGTFDKRASCGGCEFS